LSGDTQAVLATDKVRFQGQEVAAVIAESKYAAEDAVGLIQVDYDVLPAITSPQQASEPGAPVIRDEKEGQKDNHIYHWEAGDQAATDAAFARADRVVSLSTHYPRSHPAPLETCGIVADVNPATGKATLYMTSQAPHAIRTGFALVAGLPEHQIRVISPDIGGGFGNKVPVYPGYVVATAASLLIGRPVKWVEDRNENLISTGFARDFHMTGELALDSEGKMLALRVHLDSDNGAFFADAGLFHIAPGPGRHPRRTRHRRRLLHEQGARRRRVSLLVPGDGGVLSDREAGDQRRHRSWPRSGRHPPQELHPQGGLSVPLGNGLGVRQRQLRGCDEARAREARLRGSPPGAGRTTSAGGAHGHRAGQLYGSGRSGPRQGLRHPRPAHVRLGRAQGPSHRKGGAQAGREDPGPGARDDVRPDRRRRAGHSRSRCGGPARRYGQHPLRPGDLRLALDPGCRGRNGGGVPPPAAIGSQPARSPPGG